MRRNEAHLDTTKTWEERYKALSSTLMKDAISIIQHAPVRPAMWIGQFQDNRDAHFLVHILTTEFWTVMMLLGRDGADFQKKWGRSPQGYHRNVDANKTAQENLKTIKEMADDFLRWKNDAGWVPLEDSDDES